MYTYPYLDTSYSLFWPRTAALLLTIPSEFLLSRVLLSTATLLSFFANAEQLFYLRLLSGLLFMFEHLTDKSIYGILTCFTNYIIPCWFKHSVGNELALKYDYEFLKFVFPVFYHMMNNAAVILLLKWK